MDNLPYNPLLKPRARELRNKSTLAEVLLWKHLKHGQRHGFDFHRQKPILEWIADFFCAELKLVIEIDGDSHRVKAESDAAKESAFRSLGLTMLRFGDRQVKESPEGVALLVDRWIEAHSSASRRSDKHTPVPLVAQRTTDKHTPVPRVTQGKTDKHTPAFGHPSLEGMHAGGDPLLKGVPGGRGGFDRHSLALIPPTWPAEIPATRFAATLRRDNPDGCSVALLGLADDTGVKLNHGRPGAARGPAEFRTALARYGSADPAAPASRWPRVFDAGDIVPGATLDETHARITSATRALLEAGLFPIGVGGGHDLTFPFVRAVAQTFGPLTGVYFDAHLDVRETAGSGMAFRQLIECGHVHSLHLHGFRPLVNSRAHHAWFIAHGGHAALDTGAVELPPEPPRLFASFDLDVLDMAYAPGVSAPNPAGWTPAEAERWVVACGAEPRVRCFDLMELCPPHDSDGRTARLAAHLFLSFLAGYAVRLAGAQ